MTPLKESRAMSFNSDCEEMEDASVISSPPRSSHSTARLGSRCTPGSRRLFDDDDVDDVHFRPPGIGNRTPRSPLRRATLKPLDLNNDLTAEDEMESIAVGRKRSSIERRGIQSTPIKMDSANESDHTMYTSPHISPNSFITMDGRFVQSKNPFSSPMLTEEDISPPPTAAPPSLPFFTNGESKPFLPPRHQHLSKVDRNRMTPARAGVICPSGFPDKRFSFTGSPIIETDGMETDTASSGSLHKVRRFNRSDDVVAATGHHLYQRYQALNVDTSVQQNLFDEEISPTDVLSFPPPTPKKQRPSQQPYASIRRLEPETPFQERRRLPTRTPHPASRTSSEPPAKSRFYGDFDIISELGKGSFGTVYKVLSRLDGCMYAIKAAQRQAKGASDRDRMLKEVYALAALSDQADTATFHIVRYHQAWMEDDRLYIQTELCTGTLMEEISRNVLPEQRRYKLLREILLALEFIHRNHMVHLDIKPENIFLKNDQYKLGDFGLVSKVSCQQDVEEGDSRYMSMELLSGDRTDLTKSDIFSLGASMYEICLGRPLPMNGQEWQDIRHGKLESLPCTDIELTSIIFSMMHPNPAMRPSAADLLKHPKLLSDEQKALIAERSKVMEANMQLVAQAHRLQELVPPLRKGLTRANTWNGSSLPYL